MPTRTVALIVAVASIAITVPMAQGAPSKHQIKLTIRDATIASGGDHPGDRQTTAGLVSGKPFGHGVESIADRVRTATSATITLAGTMTIYTTHGTMNATITIKIAPSASGSATGTGAGKIIGGTGAYAGARGSFTFTGAESANSAVFVSHVAGSASY